MPDTREVSIAETPVGQLSLRGEKLALALLLLVALCLRGARAQEGLPYLHYWDEPHTAGRALRMVTSGDFNPHWFHYGTLTMYLNAVVDALHYLWLCAKPDDSVEALRSLAEIQTWPDEKWRYAISHPSFYGWNRWLSALLGTGCVCLTWVLGRKLFGPRRALWAAALLAVLPIHVEHSAYVTTDVAVCFFVLAVLCATCEALSARRWSALAAALILAGLTAAVKYNAGWVVCTPLAALCSHSLRRRCPSMSLGLLLALLLPLGGFLLGMPYALLDWPTFLQDVGKEVTHYGLSGHGPASVDPGLPHILAQTRNFAAALSWPGLLLALVGMARLARNPNGRLILLFPLLYFLFMTRTRVAFPRNFVVLYPFLVLGLSASLQWLWHRAEQRGRNWRLLCRGLVALGLLVPLAISTQVSWRSAHSRETRSVAAEQLAQIAAERAWSQLGIAQELRLHRIDLARLPQGCVVLPMRELMERAQEFDALLVAADYGQEKGAEDLRGWDGSELDRLRSGREVIAEIRGGRMGITATRNPGLVILRGR